MGGIEWDTRASVQIGGPRGGRRVPSHDDGKCAGKFPDGERPSVISFGDSRPRSEDLMSGRVGLVTTLGMDELAAVESSQGALNGALRQSRLLRDLVVAESRALVAPAGGAPPEEQVDDERGGTVVVSDQVAQEHVDYVSIEMEDRHGAISISTIVQSERLYESSCAMA